ncbi:hypothetical protein Tco_0606528 [Tanacetum coccineum]
MEQLDWSLVGKTQVVAVDMLWEHIPTVGLMVVENKRCGERWIDTLCLVDKTDMVKRDVEIETVGEGVDENDKLTELIVSMKFRSTLVECKSIDH